MCNHYKQKAQGEETKIVVNKNNCNNAAEKQHTEKSGQQKYQQRSTSD